ncbi:MAG: cell envelope integrity protein TolA [Thiotrichales bacterium]|nr:cell envelope integrity protein TolA [Thiotrichales bacterium]
MVGFFEKFRAFILAVVVHIAMGALLIVGFDHSAPTPKPMAREQVEIIKGSVVDETALQEHVDKIKKKEEDKRQAERDRQKALEDAAKKAKDEKRKAEQAKKKAQDETKKLVEQKVADEKRLAALAVKRKAEEEAKRKAENAKKKAEIEMKKLAEKKVIEEKRLAEIEVKRKVEEVAKQKAEAERKQVEEEKRKVDEARKKAAAEAKRKAEEKARKAHEAEEQKLFDQLLESESIGLESENQSQLQILKQRYISDIAQKVESSWLRTSNFQKGWECKVLVKQGPGGVVLSAVVTDECDGDEQFRTSVENAVYRAEPLPPPEDSSLFAKELKLTFKPED